MNQPTEKQMKNRAEACAKHILYEIFMFNDRDYELEGEMIAKYIFTVMTNDIKLNNGEGKNDK